MTRDDALGPERAPGPAVAVELIMRTLQLVSLGLCVAACGTAAPPTAPLADASLVDATQTADAASPVSDAPIEAPADTWTWVDFPTSRCASGTPTGLAVNPHDGATELLIYLQGGGECTSGEGCWGTTPSAVFLDGFGEVQFAAASGVTSSAIFDRDDPRNPLRSASQVFIPYCTGDLHAGRVEVDLSTSDGTVHPTYFWGARDLDLFLARLVPTFPDVTRIYLTGVSAGGFGTILSYDIVARSFAVRVDAVDDSGPPILAPRATRNGSLAAWGFAPPSRCTGACDTYAAVYDAARALQPSSRFGFLLYAYDTTISDRYNFATPADYTAAIDAFSESIASDPNAATFIVDDPACDPDTHRCHVVQNDAAVEETSLAWITQMWNDDPAWHSSRIMIP